LFTVPPIYVAYVSATPLNEKDALLQVLFLVFLAGETWTDEAQWKFHQAKKGLSAKERAAKGGDVAKGFCTSGPFRYSRHLNFFCEQALWWTYAAFALNAAVSSSSGCKMILCFSKLWPATGAFLLTLLFQGSTSMTERLTLAKYPAYEVYQETTSRLVPWFPGDQISKKN
jgi:steroid 5-alpha reductase family enzyme